MARSPNGQAISPARRTRAAQRRLSEFLRKAKKDGDLSAWRRAKAVVGYIQGKKVIAMADELDVTRGSINRWLQWYEADGIEGLVPKKPPGGVPRLNDAQRAELTATVVAGPQAAGYSTGVWTGPMIGDWIRRKFGVKYHNHHIPRLLHRLGFSVQRPRKRLARADLDKQEYWLRKRLPAIKKKATACRGVVLFEDEASFWLDGTLHRTWAPVGQQPRVDTYGLRKTAHLYATIELKDADFTYWFSPVFNGNTFWAFLKRLVAKYTPLKVFLIIDNAPWHNLPPEGKEWIAANRNKMELFRLPAYSPELNPMEPVWKATRKITTHNRFYATTSERDRALRATFTKFQRRPALIAAHVARFQ